MIALLPWHADIWQRLAQQVKQDRVPHGLLIAGPADAGKSLLTDYFAAYLLCQGESGPCGQCSQCLLIAAGTHPDLLSVTTEDSRQIKVDQVRAVIDWAVQTSLQGGYKLCVINPADKLNIQAANALLKCLEEPPPHTVFCLVTDQPTRLLPTLRSRCQRIECHLPGEPAALQWLSTQTTIDAEPELLLEIAGGNPLRVVRSIDEQTMMLRSQLADALVSLADRAVSPLQLAAELSKSDVSHVLDLLYQLIADTIRFTQSGALNNRDLAPQLSRYAEVAALDARYQLLGRVLEAKGHLAGTSNVNPQMQLEWLFAS